MKRVTLLDNGLFIVVFLGYFIPLLVMILMPLLANMGVMSFFS
jgi:hypothetical protein